MTEIIPTPRAMKKPMDLRRLATTIPPAYARERVLGGFAGGSGAIDAGDANGFGDAEELQNFDLDPGDIELIPGQSVAGGGRMRVVIVMPAFAEREEGNPPAISGIIPGIEAARAPQMRGRVHEPGGVEANHNPNATSPQEDRPTTKSQQRNAEHRERHPMPVV